MNTPSTDALRLRLTLALLFGLVAGGCAIDFDEKIPCDTDEHCPEGNVCDPSTHYCALPEAIDAGSDGDTLTRETAE